MRIVIATPEAVPYVKTGGLADVTGALFSQFRKMGHSVSLFLPFYGTVQKLQRPRKPLSGQKVNLGDRMYYFDVFSEKNAYFISNDYFFRRAGLYGDKAGDYPDNIERFAFFCKAMLHSIKKLDLAPDIIHSHDWQAALIPTYLSFEHAMSNIKTVFTIHNMGYQGIAPHETLQNIGIPERYFTLDGLEYYGSINLLKAGIGFADAVSTVSPTYADEITLPHFGFGLNGILKEKGVTGILNGLDYDLWDPSSDKFLLSTFSRSNLTDRRLCKQDLCKIAGFRDRDNALVGVIGRFTTQKGHDIIASAMEKIIELRANVMILGEGDPAIERSFSVAASSFPGKIYLNTSFDDTLARKIYAGSDLFLMPSRYEPCGLAQMIAMRYGSVPVVNMTGGLADTVDDFNAGNNHGTGFVFRLGDVHSMIECLKRALCVYRNKQDWEGLVLNTMAKRFKWSDSVKKYIKLFETL
ncbi:MAG: hypothetical protein BV458_06515 [Thermoplasmata archaeon M9B2D]|nr:MAG: hypothetical protein BV458_06515 [Thermoplasmata archaeon M9B2D]